MVCGHCEVSATQYIVSGLMECVRNSKGLTFDGRIPGLSWGVESASDQAEFPALRAAGRVGGAAIAVLLSEYETDTLIRPVCGQASGTSLIKQTNTIAHLIHYNGFGLVEQAIKFIGPFEFD